VGLLFYASATLNALKLTYPTGESSASNLLAAVENLLLQATSGKPDDDMRNIEASQTVKLANLQDTKRVSVKVRQKYVDAYFSYYNSAVPVIDETAFRAMHGPNYTSSPTILDGIVRSMVLAFGAFVGSKSNDHNDLPFYVEARSNMSLRTLDQESVTLVQALLLMVRSTLLHTKYECLLTAPGQLCTETR
jgi:hypothetical protein